MLSRYAIGLLALIATACQSTEPAGLCFEPTEWECPACPEPIPPRDACDLEDEGIVTGGLDGTCWWEQCRDGERSLFMKPAGVECVYRGDNNDFAIGACNASGTCK